MRRPATERTTAGPAIVATFALCALGALAPPSIARAQRASEPSSRTAARRDRGIDLASPRIDAAAWDGFSLDLGLAAIAPVALAASVTLEMPGQLQLRVNVGGLPDAAGAALGDVIGDAAAFDGEVTAALSDALGGALYFETSLGIRLIAGLEAHVGYALLWAHAAARIQGIGAHVEVASHAIHPTLGYRAVIGEWLLVRLDLGWLHTLASSATVALDQPAIDPTPVATSIATTLRQVGFTPTLALTLGVHLP